jgi:hypothetical protein
MVKLSASADRGVIDHLLCCSAHVNKIFHESVAVLFTVEYVVRVRQLAGRLSLFEATIPCHLLYGPHYNSLNLTRTDPSGASVYIQQCYRALQEVGLRGK